MRSPREGATQVSDEKPKDPKLSWNIIPELVYDIVGRVMPGAWLIVIGLVVAYGPTSVFDKIKEASKIPDTSISGLLFLALASYFVGVLVQRIYELADRPDREKWKDETIYIVKKEHPEEAARLLKISAEKSFCEIMVTGLIIFAFVDVYLIYKAGQSFLYNERFWLLLGIILAVALFGVWHQTLKDYYDTTVAVLAKLVPESKCPSCGTSLSPQYVASSPGRQESLAVGRSPTL
jgi:hypothetical protein